jgi:adenylate kinase
LNIILIGPPGAGKGTQAHILEVKRGMCQISTGDMLRASIKNLDLLGLEAKSIMDKGGLVPDDLMIRMIQTRISKPDCGSGFILDGFPRTVPQAEALEKMLLDLDKKLGAVIELKVDEAELIERVSGRFTCAKCGTGYHDTFNPTKVAGVCDVCGSTEFTRRADDNAEAMKTRLEAFHKQTAPILPFYKAKGLLKVVDGMADMQDVTKAIETALDTLR